MKRLAILLMLLAPILTGSASRVAVIEQRNVVSANGNGGQCKNATRDLCLLRQGLSRFGVNYVPIPGKAVQTEEARTMRMPSAPARYEKFSGAIIPGYAYSNGSQMYGTSSFRPDSNSRAARGGWQGPVLALSDNSTLNIQVAGVAIGDAWAGAAARRDTSGVLGCDLDCGSFKPEPGDQINFLFSDTTQTFYTTPYNPGWLRNPTPPVGGFRPLMGKQMYRGCILNSFAVFPNATEFFQPMFGPKDATSDSVVLWERWVDPVASCPNASPVVYCDWGGVGAHSDSAGDAKAAAGEIAGVEAISYDEGALGTMVAGIARLDHNMNHNLIQRGLTGALVEYGGCSRGERRGIRGIFGPDTVAYYESLARQAAQRIQVLHVVDPESLTAYPRDLQLMMSNPMAKFTFATFNGCDGATAKQVTATGHARDVFGYKRSRFIMGDGSGVGADTGAVYTQFRWAAARLDSAVGTARVCKVVVAPDDDWSPLGARQPTIDSLFWMLDSLDYHVVVADAQAYVSSYTCVGAGTNPHGWYNRQESYPARNMTTGWPKATRGVSILCHSGFSIYGGVQQSVVLDSVAGTARFEAAVEVSRAWSGLTGCEMNWDEDSWDLSNAGAHQWRDIRFRTEDLFEQPRKSYIVRINTATLSGDPANPARTGYWLASTLFASARAINTLDDGRKVLDWTWPDRILPE